MSNLPNDQCYHEEVNPRFTAYAISLGITTAQLGNDIFDRHTRHVIDWSNWLRKRRREFKRTPIATLSVEHYGTDTDIIDEAEDEAFNDWIKVKYPEPTEVR